MTDADPQHPAIPSLTLFGAAGRMGRAIIRELGPGEALRLRSAVVSAASPALGEDAGTLADRPPLEVRCAVTPEPADVAIDFTRSGAFDEVLRACVALRMPLVSGTTGLDAAQQAAIDAAGEEIPVLWAANMSLGMALLHTLVEQAAARLGPAADIEVVETHHRHKRDAPSGTALALAETAARARSQDPNRTLRCDRQGRDAPRRAGEIGVVALRAGTVAGEHTVLFGLDDERLELTHRAADRRVFVRGALAAARFLASRPPGRYHLADVLAEAASAAQHEH